MSTEDNAGLALLLADLEQDAAGEALPAGSGIAENATVVSGVGQSGEIVLAGGSFPAPETTGVYTISMTNVLASVFLAVNAPPDPSPVVVETTDTNGDSITFTVPEPSATLLLCCGVAALGVLGRFRTGASWLRSLPSDRA